MSEPAADPAPSAPSAADEFAPSVRGIAWRIALFVFAVLAAFVAVCAYISNFQPPPPPQTAGVSAERGRVLFWGKGQCSTCHMIEGKGNAVRGPNLGEWPERKLPAIGARAERRAAERRAQGKPEMTAAAYLVESVTAPGAYLVEGFGAAMPVVWQPPIALDKSEILSILLYLESMDGEPDPAGLRLPPDVERGIEAVVAGGGAKAEAALWPFRGDAARGRRLFLDEDLEKKGVVSCYTCHQVELDGKKLGREIGPELTGIAARQPLGYILESIVTPSKVVVAGYEMWRVDLKAGGAPKTGVKVAEDADSISLGSQSTARDTIRKADVLRAYKMSDLLRVRLKDGRLVVGVRRGETATELALDPLGDGPATVPKSEIARVEAAGKSIMPDGFAENLAVVDLIDLVEFLKTLR